MTEKEKEILRTYINDENNSQDSVICSLVLAITGLVDLMSGHTDSLRIYGENFDVILSKLKNTDKEIKALYTKVFWLEVVVSIMMIATVVFAITHI